MKAAIKTRLSGPDWVKELPWVLLALRATPKEDLNASPADLVYGAPLTVPGDFVEETKQPTVDEHLRRLRERVGDLKPIPASSHGQSTTKLPESLEKAKFVFVRKDAKKSPLSNPYDGPFKVLRKSDKFYMIKVGTKQDNISVDRLKAARIDD